MIDAQEDASAFITLIGNNEDAILAVQLLGDDLDEGVRLFQIASSPSHDALIDLQTDAGWATYVSDLNYFGNDSFTYRAYDPDTGGVSNIAEANMEILPVNDAPEAGDQMLTTQINTALLVTLTGGYVEDGDKVKTSSTLRQQFSILPAAAVCRPSIRQPVGLFTCPMKVLSGKIPSCILSATAN